MKEKSRFAKICCSYFSQFITRCVIFLIAAALYVTARVNGSDEAFFGGIVTSLFFGVIWVMFIAEMFFRFIPTTTMGIGCKKLFKRIFKPTDKTQPKIGTPLWRVLLLAAVWIVANAIIGVLYFMGIIDAGMLVLLSLLYSIGDLVCILFFCPFRDWFLKNRCCADCVIYDWDYAMMFTPFIFIPHPYTWSLLFVSLIVLVTWECSKIMHPERFAENTNASLTCANCKNKPCRHTRRLSKRHKENV